MSLGNDFTMPKLRIFAAITALAMLPSLAQAQDSVDTKHRKNERDPVRHGPYFHTGPHRPRRRLSNH